MSRQQTVDSRHCNSQNEGYICSPKNKGTTKGTTTSEMKAVHVGILLIVRTIVLAVQQ